MRIKAVVEWDEFDIISSVDDLKKSLLDRNIELVSSDNLVEGVFYLYFRNPYIRYPLIDSLIDFIKDKTDFPCIYSDNELIGISKSHLRSDPFFLKNFPVIYKCPDHSPIPILIYTHKRSEYLRFSLNSLFYSLGDDISELAIFMSDPSKEVEDIVKEKLKKYPSITVFRSQNNIACAAINAFLQIRKPDKFIIFEEDYILPQYTKFMVPYWPRRFSYLLERFETVNFRTSIENQHFGFYRGNLKEKDRQTNFRFKPQWITDKTQELHITGNGFASNAKFYASFGDNPPFYISGDGHVIKNAKDVCVCNIHGYHIGWNQEMDGYVSISNKNRFPNPDPIQKIIDCKTEKEYIIDLRNLVKLYV